MRIGQAIYNEASFLAVDDGEGAILPALSNTWESRLSSCQAIIDGGDDALAQLAEFCASPPRECRIPNGALKFTAPLPRPRKNVICLGWNYADHAQESAQVQGKAADIPEHPVVFTKAVTALTGPTDDIFVDPSVTEQLDWEVELAVIIGRTTKDVATSDALASVFGYMVINDISARDLQFRHKQYFIGKSLDRSTPTGPWIVTRDEIVDPQILDLRTWINGKLKQASNTRHQIFPVNSVISMLSRVMTLDPGDIIATGTPSGVGFARTPPEFLAPGDVVECEVEKIGRLRNRIFKKPQVRR